MSSKKLSEAVKFDELEHLKEENAKLKIALAKYQVSNPFEISDEQIICELEIKRLREASMDRALSTEETKQFDTYAKNLKVIKENAPIDTSSPVDELSQKELLELLSDEPKQAQ